MKSPYIDRKAALITAVVVVLVLISWLEFLDTVAADYIANVMVEAFTSFGAAKVINSTVSLLKHIEISALIMTINIGQVLDPMDRLVQQYAYLMKLSIASLIVQNILIQIVSSTFFKILLTVSGIYLIYSLAIKGSGGTVFPFKLFMFTVLLRFLIVLSVSSSITVDYMLLDSLVQDRMVPIERVAESIEPKQFRGNPDLSQTETKKLQASIATLQSAKTSLVTSFEHLESQIANRKKRVAAGRVALERQEERIGMVRSIWTDDDAYLTASNKLDAATANLDSLLQKRESLNEKMTGIVGHITQKQARLHGESGGLFDALQGFADNISSGMLDFRERVEQLVDNLGSIANDMIYVMVAFLFRTLIMPLIFLFIFAKGFKLFWHVDLSGWLKRRYATSNDSK